MEFLDDDLQWNSTACYEWLGRKGGVRMNWMGKNRCEWSMEVEDKHNATIRQQPVFEHLFTILSCLPVCLLQLIYSYASCPWLGTLCAWDGVKGTLRRNEDFDIRFENYFRRRLAADPRYIRFDIRRQVSVPLPHLYWEYDLLFTKCRRCRQDGLRVRMADMRFQHPLVLCGGIRVPKEECEKWQLWMCEKEFHS